ncbi:MAG: glycosyltransferase [Deferribacterota bacterium]|nr:glycosyltransferase [Deferribacterota bacterium]
MKICDITQLYSPISGGIKTYIEDKKSYLLDKPDFEHILIVPWKEDKVLRYKNTVEYYIKSPRIPFSKSYRLFVKLRKILNIISYEKPDLIEVNDPYITALISLYIKDKYNIPLIGFYHSDIISAVKRTCIKFFPSLFGPVLEQLVSLYIKNIYSKMNATIVTTNHSQEKLKSCGINNTHKMPFGINTKLFYPEDCKIDVFRELGLPKEAKLLLYVGRIAREKNIKMLAELPRLIEKFKVYFLFIGDGELSKVLDNISRNNPNIIHIYYIKDKNKLRRYYSAADLFVHGGVEETFGLSVLEAKACGLRVIGFKNSGLDEIINDANCLIKDRKAYSIAEKAEELLGNEFTEKDKLLMHREVAEKYEFNRFFFNLTKVYEKVGDKQYYNKKGFSVQIADNFK